MLLAQDIQLICINNQEYLIGLNLAYVQINPIQNEIG